MYDDELYEQGQRGLDEEAIVLSPEEKINGRPAVPPPGVERAGDSAVKRETNPNTE